MSATTRAFPGLLALSLSIGSLLGWPGSPAVAGGKVEATLAELLSRHQSGAAAPKDFEIEESEANDFLRGGSLQRLPDGIESPWVRFEDDLAIVGATVDLDKVRGNLPDNMLFQLVSGRVPVEITARVSGEKGIGKLDLERFLFSGIEVPASVVAQLAQSEGASKILPPGFKLGEAFPLPFELQSIRCRMGALSLRQGPTSSSSAK